MLPALKLAELFSDFGAQRVLRRISSFGGLDDRCRAFCEVSPRTTDELAATVRLAYERGVPVRTRGQGHAANGSSVPSENELLIRTERICDVHFAREGSVTAGAGIVLWTLRSYVRRFGLNLAVVNDGYAAPSLGGFVAAGGFGQDSNLHGGIWDNTENVVVVDGRGNTRSVERGDPFFAWLFGSMGQLAIVAGARLTVVPLTPGESVPYPIGVRAACEEIAASSELHGPGPPEEEQGKSLFWFTLFVPGASCPKVDRQLTELERKYGALFRYKPRYRYPILRRHVVPPLVYGRPESFFAIGSWMLVNELTSEIVSALHAFDAELTRLAAEGGYRRYIQTEIGSGVEAFRANFGDATYGEFRRLKAREDPAGILNRGSVFSSPA